MRIFFLLYFLQKNASTIDTVALFVKDLRVTMLAPLKKKEACLKGNIQSAAPVSCQRQEILKKAP